MRINVKKFVDSLRPENPDALTPAQLQSFLLYLLVEVEKEQELLLEAKGIADGFGQIPVVDSIQRDVNRFRQRIFAYLEEVNAAISDGQGDEASYGLPVSRPLFRGLFPEGYRASSLLPGSKPSPLCEDVTECTKMPPDIASPAIIRNQLDAFVEADRVQSEKFFEEIKEGAREVCALTSGACALYQLLEPSGKKEKSDAIPWWKWMLYGAGGVVGLTVVFKILK